MKENFKIVSTNLNKDKKMIEQFEIEFQSQLESLITSCFNLTCENKIESLMVKLPKIIPKLKNPFRFSNYILKGLNNSDNSVEMKILCLNSLIILMGKYSFEFKNYYFKLYEVLQSEYLKSVGVSNTQSLDSSQFMKSDPSQKGLFNNKYSSKFMKILEISFRSPQLALNVLISFVKVNKYII